MDFLFIIINQLLLIIISLNYEYTKPSTNNIITYVAVCVFPFVCTIACMR